MYTVIDIETTGGKFNEEGITEIAIHRFDGHEVIDSFISLINPEKEIQPFVIKLTGITPKMCRTAPKFHEVAKRIIEITEGTTLVAHNADFDYRILQNAFKDLGFDFVKNTLCTVELSRKLLPEEDSYSLGKLCKSLGIPMSGRHRANGDALATVQLFKMLLEKDDKKEILISTIRSNIQNDIRPKLDRLISSIPRKLGIYYLHRSDGQIIYMGKAKNMKSSVNNIFVRKSTKAIALQQLTSSVSYDLTGNKLITDLKFNHELKVLKPKFNRRLKPYNHYEPFELPNFLITENGRNIDEKGVILIEEGELKGYTYVNLKTQLNRVDILEHQISELEDTALAHMLIHKALEEQQTLNLEYFEAAPKTGLED
jgi:DNA polymerase-3 subunit epsilon